MPTISCVECIRDIPFEDDGSINYCKNCDGDLCSNCNNKLDNNLIKKKYPSQINFKKFY